MTLLVSIFSVLLLGAMLFFAFRFARKARFQYVITKKAHNSRLRLAEFAHRIETDSTTSKDAKEFVSFLADRAFDEEFMQKVRAGSASEDSVTSQELTGEFRECFGEDWRIAIKAAHEYAEFALLDDIDSVVENIRKFSKEYKRERRRETASLFDRFVELMGGNGNDANGDGQINGGDGLATA